MAGLEQLISEVSAFLADNTEHLAKFNDLVDEINAKTGTGHEIQSGILELVSGNEDLTKMVKEATPLFTFESKGSIAINSIIENLEKELEDDLFAKFSQVASLFMSQYVTFTFFNHYTRNVLSAEILASIAERMSDIEASSSCNFDVYNLSGKFSRLKPNNDLKSSETLRFYISMGYLLTEEKLETAIKCMRLYAWGFITHEQALTWLEVCDSFIVKSFNELAGLPQSDLLPSRVFDSIAQEAKEGTLEWIFGSELFAILKEEPKTQAKNLIQLSNERTLEKNKNFVNNDQSAVPYIADLKMTKFFGTLKAGARAIRTGKHIMAEIPEGVIESVLGRNCQVDKTDKFFRVFFRKVRELGADASKTYTSFLQNKFDSLDPSTPDGRAAYGARMMPATILCDLVFNGAKFASPPKEVLDAAFTVTSKTMEKFKQGSVGSKYSSLVAALKRGTIDCDDGAILAIYYFMELVRTISMLDEKHRANVEQIPTLVFSEEPPLHVFQGEVIANIDIILLNMAKQLKKLNEGQLTNQEALAFSGDFIFHVEVKDEIVISPGTMNMFS